MADVLASTLARTTAADAPVIYRMYMPQGPELFPRPPWETHSLRVVLQGGGVYVYTGTVSIVNSQVYSNQATEVRAHAQKFPSPRWEFHIPGFALVLAGHAASAAGIRLVQWP